MSKSKKKKKSQADPNEKTVSDNRKARHKYEVLDTLECGLVLVGSEVKSLRNGKLSLAESYARVRGGEVWLIGADIPVYAEASFMNHDPKRPRKLLVHALQLRKLASRLTEKGLTIVPLRVYFNARGIVKVMIGVGRGKKLHDKRSSLREREVKRQIDRAMKR